MRAILVISVAVVALVASALASTSDSCYPPQQAANSQQTTGCALDTPYCVNRQTTLPQCSECRVDTFTVGGGSCDCPAATHYCSRAVGSSGLCAPYSLLGRTCTQASDCISSTSVVQADGRTQLTMTNELLYCVAGRCRVCSPTAWQQYVGTPGTAVRTCGGYDAALSNRLMRYATATRNPATSYTCLSNGTVVVLNSTVDFNFGYLGGDRSTWVYSASTTTTTTSSTATRTASTATTGAQANSYASDERMISVVVIALVALFAAAATV